MKVLAISNKVQVISFANDTKVVEFGDSKDVYGFKYSEDVDFRQQFRVDLKLWKARTVESGKSYRDSSGTFQNNNVIIDRVVDLQTGYLDDRTHLALTIASKHSYFAIDGKQYYRQEEYAIEHQDESGDISDLSMAKTTLIEQTRGFTNQTC